MACLSRSSEMACTWRTYPAFFAHDQAVIRVTLFVMAYLVAIESPWSELHLAVLLIEWKVLDVYGTRALVDGGRNPQHLTVTEHHHVRLVWHLVLAVSTGHNPLSVQRDETLTYKKQKRYFKLHFITLNFKHWQFKENIIAYLSTSNSCEKWQIGKSQKSDFLVIFWPSVTWLFDIFAEIKSFGQLVPLFKVSNLSRR